MKLHTVYTVGTGHKAKICGEMSQSDLDMQPQVCVFYLVTKTEHDANQ